MNLRAIVLLLLLSDALAQAAPPAGFACPVPRSLHGAGDDASLRAARDNWLPPADCCGVLIDNVKFSAAGVVCWPLLETDEVEAQGWPVAIVLFDGSRILLGEGSKLRFVARNAVVRIVSGTLHWQFPATSRWRMAALDRALTSARGMGQLHDGKLQVTPNVPFPHLAPDLSALIRRFAYASGRLIPSDGM